MRTIVVRFVFLFSLIFSQTVKAQVNEHETGAWYMYFWNADIKKTGWGFQGDIQYRNWNIMGDLEQMMLRAGVTYKPKSADIMFTQGYAHIISGEYGDGTSILHENRIYQEVFLPHKVGERFHLKHRFRYEQRFVQNQDFRTRYRYAFFINVPFNKTALEAGSFYLALYDELFINGQRDTGNGNTVQIFDRNRAYAALGYAITDNLKTQLGYMQQTTNGYNKGQLQLSFHHKF